MAAKSNLSGTRMPPGSKSATRRQRRNEARQRFPESKKNLNDRDRNHVELEASKKMTPVHIPEFGYRNLMVVVTRVADDPRVSVSKTKPTPDPEDLVNCNGFLDVQLTALQIFYRALVGAPIRTAPLTKNNVIEECLGTTEGCDVSQTAKRHRPKLPKYELKVIDFGKTSSALKSIPQTTKFVPESDEVDAVLSGPMCVLQTATGSAVNSDTVSSTPITVSGTLTCMEDDDLSGAITPALEIEALSSKAMQEGTEQVMDSSEITNTPVLTVQTSTQAPQKSVHNKGLTASIIEPHSCMSALNNTVPTGLIDQPLISINAADIESHLSEMLAKLKTNILAVENANLSGVYSLLSSQPSAPNITVVVQDRECAELPKTIQTTKLCRQKHKQKVQDKKTRK